MKTTIILSGGADSSTLAYYLRKNGDDLLAVSFMYGQRHFKEIECAAEIAKSLNIKHFIVDISQFGKLLESSLTQDNEVIPEGHYQAENMKSTVVPNRNAIMALMAHAIGYSRGYKNIALGVHAGDHFIYPDCRREAITDLEYLLRSHNDDETIQVVAPFIEVDKTNIIKLGLELGVPYEKTWTCYSGREKACGKCGSCNERLESFKKLNQMDPLKYES